MPDTETVVKIDANNIAVITRMENKQIIAKETLEAQKVDLLNQIANIDKLLTNFS